MRVFPTILSSVITIGLVVALNKKWGPVPPLGKFLSPQHGFWQNAEPADANYNEDLAFTGLAGRTDVYIDDRLVPHIFAEQESDAYFVQGYLHAKFRLWQMEFQTHAAAGRLSEVLGEKVGDVSILDRADRQFRRLGMVYAAQRALAEAEKDPITKIEMDNYTAGVNAYIANLPESNLPIEYKLLDYQPEKWSNIKTALFLKYMSYDLAGSENDLEYTNAKTVFDKLEFDKLFPVSQDSLDPIIPRGTLFDPPGITITPPASVDSLYLSMKDSTQIREIMPDKDNGSNNWAVSGSRTQSGVPILCNDPHLALNFPSLWFEMQISTPEFNAYGVSFPGAPSVIIGFNDQCAWGFTNAGRDVRDYFEIRFRDESMMEYWFDSSWKKTEFRYDTIRVRGQDDFIDTVAYTVFGPVMYDKRYDGGRGTNGSYYAVRWKAHDPSNELKMFNRLNHAKNYDDYLEAIKNLKTPGQNCIFACKTGDIAIWAQGEFPAKWYRQGDFIMPGTDSSYMWQGNIPQHENPHQVNPERGFVSSANQLPVDPATYPYYLGGSFPPYRGMIINRQLREMYNVTVDDMKKLQTNNYNIFAEMARPVILQNLLDSGLSREEKKFLDLLKNWNLRNDPEEKGATLFANVWDEFEHIVWEDEYNNVRLPLMWPYASTLLEAVLKDTAFQFLDNINTPVRESLKDDITAAFRQAVLDCRSEEIEGKLEWASHKATGIFHLLKIHPFNRENLPIGGGNHIINAAKSNHGPSWRMIVQLTDKTEAYGVYPGGQSGNPGSKYYDSFVNSWVTGQYYSLWLMRKEEAGDPRVKWKMVFNPKSI